LDPAITDLRENFIGRQYHTSSCKQSILREIMIIKQHLFGYFATSLANGQKNLLLVFLCGAHGANAADSEDYAIAKYFTLRELGLSQEKLKIICVKAI